ncbi:hypothetical protein GCQ56_07705 [Marinifilum sp. N1E240]|uniref:phage head-tail connector protein n=1 Tax=Marinifilum sp. N1E240 TaxID=2608082 RepID=UPI00128D89C4|nr:phage head-tail connector protein [Marinifilum sp. N1E240]MPQ46898.1 hypothetical protein [Marinifilum sp. N1E240]
MTLEDVKKELKISNNKLDDKLDRLILLSKSMVEMETQRTIEEIEELFPESPEIIYQSRLMFIEDYKNYTGNLSDKKIEINSKGSYYLLAPFRKEFV